jgi:cytochrome c2
VLLAALVGLRGVAADDQRSAPADAVKGKELFATQKCSVCHTVGASGGKLGPDLTAVGTRRNAEWLKKYLPKPQAFDPKNKMPPVQATGQDLNDLVAYLTSLKGKTLDTAR